jgi:hypothetical protein
VSQNFASIPLKRVGVLSDKPFDGFIAIRLEFWSLLSLSSVVLFTLLLWEHFRFVRQRVQMLRECGDRFVGWVCFAWSCGYWYATYRSCGWLFMYLNEWWLNLLATQIYLTATETFCCWALFSGYLEFDALAKSGHWKNSSPLPSATLPITPSSRTLHKWIKAIVLGVKLGHLEFTLYDMTFGGSSLFGDQYRNFMFVTDDIGFVWLFLTAFILEVGSSKRMLMIEVFGSNVIFWMGLFMFQSVIGSQRVS